MHNLKREVNFEKSVGCNIGTSVNNFLLEKYLREILNYVSVSYEAHTEMMIHDFLGLCDRNGDQ